MVVEYQDEVLSGLGVGSYSVMLTEVRPKNPRQGSGDSLFVAEACMVMLGYKKWEAYELPTKIEHIGPQEIVSGIALDGAVMLKNLFEQMNLRAEIKEGRPRSVRSTGSRESIPEAVRSEVWRRDGGACVDCGSRERLEFDHIIPVSKGGANTVRNIELRCEVCSRSKGAKI